MPKGEERGKSLKWTPLALQRALRYAGEGLKDVEEKLSSLDDEFIEEYVDEVRRHGEHARQHMTTMVDLLDMAMRAQAEARKKENEE